ncbi:translation initiation factor eIF4e [Lojkania enalia]|uniref:Translation initiation factor eIF4e n=1 Tax=Lojkania enalia TaxID=147567 RepID=A0A9P4K202_9PLEO|nr:translation initiation factor eIF4e [Didymosphaeria enalia]
MSNIDINRLIGMLQVSAARISREKIAYCDLTALSPVHEDPEVDFPISETSSTGCSPIPCSLLEAFELVLNGGPLPSYPREQPKPELKVDLDKVLCTFNTLVPTSATDSTRTHLIKETALDLANDLAVATARRIFAAAKNPKELVKILENLNLNVNMANRIPLISTSNLPSASASESAQTASPARGTAMLNSIFKSVRVPEFRFKWQFWAEKGQQSSTSTPASKSSTGGAEEYASRPKPLGGEIVSVKEFYQHFNNIPTESLKLRDSIHLFHLGVKPLWEDPRNARGGAFYFRVSKEVANQAWHEVCLLAVGDVLQGAVETKRESFNDDICGISYSVRWNAVQIAVWNRDADNEAGKEKLLQTILEKLSDEVKPKKDSYWYKAHKEHKGFVAPTE